jgi:hypothetical protein
MKQVAVIYLSVLGLAMVSFFFCSFLMHHFVDLKKSDSLEYGRIWRPESNIDQNIPSFELSNTLG